MDRWLNNVNFVRIAAVLLGILLWLVVRLNYEQITPGQSNPIFQTDTIVDARVTAVGLDQDQYHLSSIQPETVDIIVQGVTSRLNRIPTSQYSIIADLTGLTEGTHQVPLSAINFPSGVDVTLSPDVVTVKIERMETKQFDVQIELRGTPAEGLKAGVPVANPVRVHATVPGGRLDEIHSIRGYIDVQGATDTIIREVKLEAYNSAGQLLEDVVINPSIVSVEVPVNPPFRSVPLQVSFTGRPPQGLSVAEVSQDTQFVTIFGQQELIDKIEFYEGITVDLSTLTDDTTLTIEVPLMDGITKVEPGDVQVTIDLEPTVQRTFNEVPIRLFGNSDVYDIEMTAPEGGVISLTVAGAPALVNSLTAGDVQVILDVSNIAPGSYVLPLRVNLPRFVTLSASDELRASIVVVDPDAEPASSEAEEEASGDAPEVPEPPVEDEGSQSDSEEAEVVDETTDAGSPPTSDVVESGQRSPSG